MAAGTHGVFLADVENSFLVAHTRQMSRAAWSVPVLQQCKRGVEESRGAWGWWKRSQLGYRPGHAL